MKVMYRCEKCGWMGPEEKLVYIEFESCMSSSEVEVCPKCGDKFVKKVDETNNG